MSTKRGFTLIEVLIALGIISIALTAVIKASTQSIHTTNYLQDKMIGTWLGESLLNEVRLGIMKTSHDTEKTFRKTTVLNQDWYWRILQKDTANNHIKKYTVDIYQQDPDQQADKEANAIVSLETYVYRVHFF